MIAVFSFFLFYQELLIEYNLDFILVGTLFIMDIIYYLIELVTYMKKGVPP